jgi:asparagine synthase (glutamine-hydrolysing)
MASGIELRSPFLDYRVVELGLRQTRERKVYNGRTKFLVRSLAKRLIPKEILEQPKRPVQTPQREWLRNELSPFVDKMIMDICDGPGSDFLECDKIVSEYSKYKKHGSDNSFTIYQIISLGMLSKMV